MRRQAIEASPSAPSELIDRAIVHYALHDPRAVRGGVETFARDLTAIFREVRFMTPKTLDLEQIRAERLPVVCDNHWVQDLPESIPAIAFQHGVAWRKFLALRERGTLELARRQARAARRKNTLWVACARWIGEAFGSLHGNGASHVIHHPIDLERFGGEGPDTNSRVLLHDGRARHKGSLVYPWLAPAFPDWRFETLDCAPSEVPARLRQARAFLHLSRYEGNSIVCNEAMAMNLPCFFTRVGLLLDGFSLDVKAVPPSLVYGPLSRLRRGALRAELAEFLGSLEHRRYAPRAWVEANASPLVARERWRAVLRSFDELTWT